MTRAFVAVALPEAVLDAVARATSELALSGRLTTRAQWHLTLQFLGDDVDVDAVLGSLLGLDAERGVVRLGGAGAFPDARHASVLWLGLAQGAGIVAHLADGVCARTAQVGYASDDRPFRPHITLARFRQPIDAREVIARIGEDPIGPAWTVDGVTVYESRRDRDGARYLARGTVPLPV